MIGPRPAATSGYEKNALRVLAACEAAAGCEPAPLKGKVAKCIILCAFEAGDTALILALPNEQ